MSRVHRRTFQTRANIGGSKTRMAQRLGFRKTGVGALHKANPAGAKAAKKILKGIIYLTPEPSATRTIGEKPKRGPLASRNARSSRTCLFEVFSAIGLKYIIPILKHLGLYRKEKSWPQ